MNTTRYAHLPFRFALGLCAALPLAASALTVGNLSDGSLSGNTLTVTADVSGVAANATATLWLGQAAPKDGDPAALLQETNQSISFTGDGTATFTPHVILGTKVAFKVVVTEGGDSAESGVKTMTLKDTTTYNCSNKTGVWSDPGIWNEGTDNGNRLGYPSYGSKFVFTGGTCNIQVDAEYTELKGKSFGWNGVNVTLTGTVPGAALKGGYGVECYSANLTLDAVRVECAGYDVKDGCSLRLLNGAYFSSRWWITANRPNSTIYVGPNSTLRASTEWWYGVQISRENAVLEIEDGYAYIPHLRLGADSNTTPKGIVFRGTTPRLVVGQECLITRSSLNASPVIEFVVPLGGYATAPISVDARNDVFMFAGHYYLDHATDDKAVHGAPPILFKVNEYSPFFSGSLVDDVLLVDWSNGGAAGINTDKTDCGIDYVAFEDPDHNNFYTDSNVDGVAATRIWAHLTGTGEPSSKTIANESVTGTTSGSTLTVTASLFDYDGGNGTSTATLYVGHAGPGGDPTTNMTAVANATLANGNDFTLSTEVILGSQTAYAVVVENTQGQWHYTSSTATNIVQVRDSAQYVWVNNNSGLWSDPANWTCTVNDDKARLGYPSYGNSVRWLGNQTAVVEVDAAYTGLADAFVDNPGLNLTLIGTVEGASALFSNAHCTFNTHITLDNVASSTGGFGVGDNGEFRLVNGASFSTAWRCEIEGNNSLLYVGEGCRLNVATSGDGYEYRLGLAGTDSRIVLDGGTIVTRCVKIGKTKTAVPYGIVFSGKNPVMRVAKQFRIEQELDNGGSPLFLFSVPEGGWEQAPIQRSAHNEAFLDQSMGSGIPDALFQIDRHSPFFNECKTADVPLVAWDNTAGINTSGIEFEARDDVRFFYTPDEAATKTGLWVNMQGHGHTLVLFR